MERAYTLAELARHADARLEGPGEAIIRRVGTLEAAGPDAITFLANPRYRDRLGATRAGAVIVAPGEANATATPRLIAANPYLAYAKVARLLHPESAPVPGIDPAAHVHPSAALGEGVSIAAGAIVGADCSIGRAASIGALVVVGEGCVIGDGVVLHPHVVVYPRCIIGPRTTVHAGAVIGADGFGMAEADGRWLRIPQVGRVVIGADCEIGANTTIDRGAIEDTVLGDDVKLDNQIQIGHNCVIGSHTAIAGCVGIAGSTRIGRNVKIGGAAMISGHLSIPDGTLVSGATVIDSTIEAPGVYTSVFPYLPHRQWKQVAGRLRQLREIERRLRALERGGGE